MLCFNLTPIFKARGIEKPFTFLVQAGFSYHTAHLLMHGQSRSFKLDNIERLCTALVCEPNDLLLWMPDAKEHNPDVHALAGLRAAPEAQDMHAKLRTMPYKELKAMQAQQ